MASLVVVVGASLLVLVAGWAYFRRYRAVLPPVGVFNIRDVTVFLLAIILVPYLYLWIPLGVVTVIMLALVGSGVYIALEPVMPHRALTWICTVGLLGGDVTLALTLGTFTRTFLVFNDIVLLVAVVGVTNIWAQSGMKARDITILVGLLGVYDLAATTLSGLMGELLMRLMGLPFTPLIRWVSTGVGVGLGDLMLVTAFPLVMRKAFGRRAGVVALVVEGIAMAALPTLLHFDVINQAIPAMTVLAPLLIAQYVYWRSRSSERRTWEYLLAEPLGVRTSIGNGGR